MSYGLSVCSTHDSPAALKHDSSCDALVFPGLTPTTSDILQREFNNITGTLQAHKVASDDLLLRLVGSKVEVIEQTGFIAICLQIRCWFSNLFKGKAESKKEPAIYGVRIAIQPKPAPQIEAGPGTGSRPEAKNFSNIPSAVEGV